MLVNQGRLNLQARRFLERWHALSPGGSASIVASVPTYGPHSEGNLGAYLGAIEDLVDGVIAWSEPSTSALEWKTPNWRRAPALKRRR